MRLKPLIFLAIATGLYFIGRSLEMQGDAAPFGANGVSPERAKYHIAALVLMLAALASFVFAGWTIFRGRRS